jgi:hypothetical protein
MRALIKIVAAVIRNQADADKYEQQVSELLGDHWRLVGPAQITSTHRGPGQPNGFCVGVTLVRDTHLAV